MNEETMGALFVGGLFLLFAVACVVFAWLREEQELKPWSMVDVGLALISLVSFSGGALVLYQGVSGQQENLFIPSMFCSAFGALASLGVVFLRASPAELGLRQFPIKWVFVGLGLVLPFMLFTWGWMELIEWVAGPTEEQAIVDSVRNPSSQSDRMAGLFYAIVIAPLAEEIMFRGFLLGALQRAMGVAGAIVLSGVIFGFFHIADPITLIPLSVMGCCLGWLRVRSDSIWPAWMMHIGNNGLALWMVTLAGP